MNSQIKDAIASAWLHRVLAQTSNLEMGSLGSQAIRTELRKDAYQSNVFIFRPVQSLLSPTILDGFIPINIYCFIVLSIAFTWGNSSSIGCISHQMEIFWRVVGLQKIGKPTWWVCPKKIEKDVQCLEQLLVITSLKLVTHLTTNIIAICDT